MEAIVLAGGLGTRLRSTVPNLPKPMAPVGGRPFLEILLETLARKGIGRVIMSIGYMAECISNHFGRGFAGLDIEYAIEDAPLGTGGALRGALARCSRDNVLVLNGDTYLDLEVASLAGQWRSDGFPLIVARQVPDTGRYGRLTTVGKLVVGFDARGVAGAGLINAGYYWFPTSIAELFPATQRFSLETEFLSSAVTRTSFAYFRTEGEFIDIGVPADYERAQLLLAAA